MQFARSPRDFAQRHAELPRDVALRRTLVDFFDEQPSVCKIFPFRRRKKAAEKIPDKFFIVRFGDEAAELLKTRFERFLCRAVFFAFRPLRSRTLRGRTVFPLVRCTHTMHSITKACKSPISCVVCTHDRCFDFARAAIRRMF